MIDVNVLAGSASPYSIDDARTTLQQHAVGRGLLAMRAPRHERANAAVLSVTDAALLPVATLNPVQYLDWPAELERVQAAGAVAVRFFPDSQSWSVDSEAFQALRRTIRVPLLLPVERFGDATRIGQATEGDRPVVLTGAHYTQLGDCLAALERWPHLFLETSRLAHFRALETVVNHVGANRVLFGSGAPARPVQAALNMVLTARIVDADKRAILSGNAARVFGLPEQPFDMPIPTPHADLIDVHGHFGALGLPTPAVSPHEQVAEADRHGIALTIASSLDAIADDRATGNAEALAASTQQLRAYVVVDPNDLQGSCSAMDSAYASGALGAKLHCSYAKTPTVSRSCMDLLDAVAERERPLLIHVDGPDWDAVLLDVAQKHPRWNIILAQSGPGTPTRAAACLAERTENVYLELCTSFPDLPAVREIVQRVSPDKLLFGTDAPLLDAAYALGLYHDAGADLVATTRVAREVFAL